MFANKGTTHITTLRQKTNHILAELNSAQTVEDSRVVLTKRGRPVAVIQDYNAYQELISWASSAQRTIQIAETRERIRLLDSGLMQAVPLREILQQQPAPQV